MSIVTAGAMRLSDSSSPPSAASRCTKWLATIAPAEWPTMCRRTRPWLTCDLKCLYSMTMAASSWTLPLGFGSLMAWAFCFISPQTTVPGRASQRSRRWFHQRSSRSPRPPVVLGTLLAASWIMFFTVVMKSVSHIRKTGKICFS
ncbi:hypothetical protein D9M68_795150 [compost metagenome]